jgi:pyruvate/2-oxoglutarate dehydrogenase complex dihydrolipoamide acyltransferase (E2) component
MIRDLLLPQLAMGMSEGTIVEWAVAEGDKVQRDQTLVSIETEKVVTDLPAPYNGYVHLLAEVGDALPVETPMGQIAETEEEYRSLLAGSPVAPAAEAAAEAPKLESAAATSVRESERPSGRIRASGLAKAIARQQEIDLASLAGTGPAGRIVRRDVMAALASRPNSAPAAAPNAAITAVSEMREKARVPLTGMRKVIADRMVTAKTTAAHTYAFFEIDITKLLAVRQTMLAREAELGSRVSLLALQVRALALACRHVPICNATVGDQAITVWDNVNIGIAVALPGKGEYDSGLVVPVLRNVEAKGILEIDQEIRGLVSRARDGTLTSADMADGTITLSSTGGFAPGVWSVSTPLLNLPQVVNFQPGSPLEKPIVVDGQVAVRSMLPCGLSFDHRAVDGEPIGRFAKKLIDLLAHPELMLL